MATPERELKTDRLHLRLSHRQRQVIDDAAHILEKDVSAFVLDAALTSAEHLDMDRRAFVLDSQSWEQFVEVLDRPIAPIGTKSRLEKLLAEPSVLEH